MLSEAQIQYLTEVLGTSPDSYRVAVTQPLPPPTLVLTPSLNTEEKALLDRILQSIQLNDVVHKVIGDLIESVDETGAQHILVFSEKQPPGRTVSDDGQVVWGMGELHAMMGDGPEVAQAKKTAWGLLQKFNKERLGDQ